MTTLETLQARIARLQAQAEEIVRKESTTVLAKIKELMDRHDLTTADIDAYMSGRKSSGKVGNKPSAPPAMYRNPKTGATWSGRGRAPGWIARAKDRSKYSVERDAVIGATVNKTPAKAGNYVRGPQPALYADPKTGATWSGRGRAPAWIAGAKDRSKFLIAGATELKGEPKATL
ncbi:H-NS family nucleoid-associated regulatory protein [Paraburkholderia caledonica]|uniref:DNA-binding protein H-NS n=2 Tax=Paraburkholderia caledonica TaxID=134536 RepID=A0ABU1KYQ4_9BURK|nr:H-NS family nucleoid-associated regulatory protein [Paraburkholderia caledonica]MDR6376116.1 DNA-binding protein H-NS [Paraburkholderia caledonica]